MSCFTCGLPSDTWFCSDYCEQHDLDEKVLLDTRMQGESVISIYHNRETGMIESYKDSNWCDSTEATDENLARVGISL